MKKRYYSLNNILGVNAVYNIIYGMRSNGKSYAVKKYCVEESFLHSDRKFVYLRRYSLDINTYSVQQYFSDLPIKDITNGEYNAIEVYRKMINLVAMDLDGKIEKRKHVGYVMHLSGVEHFKSLAYPDVENIIFEEFVTNEGYLQNETTKLMSIISTVFRDRDGKIFMIGNSVNRICPYFSEWQLTNIPTQEVNTIDTYNVNYEDVTIKIACEYCGDSDSSNNKFFFGRQADSIIKGHWECDTYPKPPTERNGKHSVLSRILLHHEQFDYIINLMEDRDGYVYLKITPSGNLSIDSYDMVITKEFSVQPLHVRTLKYFTIGKKLKMLFDSGKVCYSDNLTGTEFNNIIAEWDIW